MVGLLSVNKFFNSLRFLRPASPCPRPLAFCVAIVSLSPFILRVGGARLLLQCSLVLQESREAVVGLWGRVLGGLHVR